MSELVARIEAAWDARETVTPAHAAVRASVEEALGLLDAGAMRVAEPDGNGGWKVNQWLKKAVLLSFRLTDNGVMEGGSAGAPAFDKVPLKFAGWDDARFRAVSCGKKHHPFGAALTDVLEPMPVAGFFDQRTFEGVHGWEGAVVR